MEKFKELYSKAESWADLDVAIAELNKGEQIALVASLKIVKACCGIDMRQDFLLSTLDANLKYE